MFGAAFKAKVALAAVRGDKTTAQLAVEFERAYQPGDGLEEAAAGAGGRSCSRTAAPKSRDESAANEQELYEQIGRLKMEVEWLKKKSAELGLRTSGDGSSRPSAA